jgi:predicted MFS family arabinose efflux permease
MSNDAIRLVKLTVLGSVAILPLLILPTMVGALVDYAGFTESAAGWVASAGFAGGAGAAVLLALRIRHLDPRMLALAGLMTLAVADSLSALAMKMPLSVFLGLRVVSGIGGATAYAAVMATIAASDMPERGYGVFSVFQFGLSAVGLYMLPLVLADIGVTGMYLGLAAAAVLAMPLFGSVLTRGPAAKTSDPAIEIHMLLKPAAILAMLGIGLYEAANTMHFTYAERIGVSFGLADHRIGEILGIVTVIGMPAAFGVVWLGNRFGDLLPILAALLLSIAALGLLMLSSGQGTYIVAMCALSIAWAFGLPYFQSVEARLDPGGSVVVAGGFFTSGGGALGPAMAAMLVGGQGYAGVLLAAICIYLVAAALMTVCLRLVTRH